MSGDVTNCRTCKALVYALTVPTKSTGNCWRCEVKRLQGMLDSVCKELRVKGAEHPAEVAHQVVCTLDEAKEKIEQLSIELKQAKLKRS